MEKLKISKKIINKKVELLKNIVFILVIFLFSFLIFYFSTNIFSNSLVIIGTGSNFQENFLKQQKKIREFRKSVFITNAEELKKKGCVEVILQNRSQLDEEKTCKLNQDLENCLFGDIFFLTNPVCKYFNTIHMQTPEEVKVWYYTAYSGLSNSKISRLINNQEINSVIIDVKEVDGKIHLSNKLKSNIKKLHQNGIYVIARIVVFKDNKLVAERPDLAIKKKSNQLEIWQDYAKKKWLDPLSKEVWDYNKNIARDAYLAGFDEINFDYVRFPSDGNMADTFYPFSNQILQENSRWGKAIVIDKFFQYITSELRKEFPKIKLSADLFGYTATNYDDLNIGQILESAVLYFDFVAPMTYPSHYSWGHLGFADGPDNHPYEVIHYSLQKAQEKIDKLNEKIRQTKKDGNKKVEIRPGFRAEKNIEHISEISKDALRFWLQAFTCTWCKKYKPYTSVEIDNQKQAIYDLGGHSWMLWNAASRYPS